MVPVARYATHVCHAHVCRATDWPLYLISSVSTSFVQYWNS